MRARRIRGIDCEDLAVVGIRHALKERFAEMYAFRQEASKWKDPEGVHSMRVASRRLRSALRDFMPYVEGRDLNSTQKQLRNIADALGKVRDQDVAIAELEKLASETPPKFSSTVRRLIRMRKKVRRTARQELKKVIEKARLKDLRLQFERAVETATGMADHHTTGTNQPLVSYLDVARSVICNRLDELEKLSDSLYRPLEAKPLHEMRIAAKRLRYAIELFEGCWPANVVSYAREVAHLQTELGKLHDCDTWLESLGEEIVETRKSMPRSKSESFVWLFTHFNEQRNLHFRGAFSQWTEWQAKKLSVKLKKAIQVPEI